MTNKNQCVIVSHSKNKIVGELLTRKGEDMITINNRYDNNMNHRMARPYALVVGRNTACSDDKRRRDNCYLF